MPFWRSSVVTSLAFVVLAPTAHAAARASTLPLTRVRLYETGVGYFERSGAVPGGDTTLPVPAGHLDDALKTLVVLGGDVKVSGVAFSSSVSRDMARKLAGLPEQGEQPLSFSELSRTFKGASVTIVTAAGSHQGRLVEVLEPGQGELERCAEAQPKAYEARINEAPCPLVERGSLLLLGAGGELRRIASADVLSLRPSEPAARARLDAALDALSQRGAQTRREVAVLTTGGGKVTLGYVAEAPVWRSTYRIVLGADEAKLQGWALLHNDTDEDWQSVQVDLVNGRPTSFLYPLAAPRYARRELVTPSKELPSVPQLFDTTVDNLWTVNVPDAFGYGEGGAGRGEGIGLGSIGTLGHGTGTGLDVAESSELDIGNLASLTPAAGEEAAALFRYALPSQLALRAHASALVPFLDTAIKVRQVSWFSAQSEAGASALHVTNDTAQTLPAGTLSVFSDGGFVGESLLPRSKPNQSHLLGYGVELDVELTRERGSFHEEPRLFAFEHDMLQQHYLRRRTQKLALVNRSRGARTVYVELDMAVDNARVEGAKELARDAETRKTYSVIEIAAGEHATQTLKIEEGLARKFPFPELDAVALGSFAAGKTTQAAQRAVLQRAAAHLLQAEKRRGAKPRRQAELDQALSDVARMRENARILGAVRAKQVDGMAQRVVELESRVTQLRARIAELTVEAETFTAAAKRELGRL
jgi:hypothetical protein